ncbi:MAG: hypothetical protein ACP5M9_00155 [Candidatus Micrarchaeia archaeon]
MADNSLVERMLYRLVKKHIAGTTMSAAISKAAELNVKKIPVSVMFLSGTIDTKSKARYITSTYMELIRRLSRLGIKASVHIKAEQLGVLLDNETTVNNLNDILNTAKKCGIFVWLELPKEKVSFIEELNGTKGYGVAVDEENAINLIKNKNFLSPVKILFNDHSNKDEKYVLQDPKIKNKKAKSKNTKKEKNKKAENIKKILMSKRNTVISSPPDSILKELLSIKNDNKSNFFIEFKFGYSPKKLKKYLKKNKNITIFVPFGKDWTEFAMNSVPEGYMRFLANSLLSEKNKG